MTKAIETPDSMKLDRSIVKQIVEFKRAGEFNSEQVSIKLNIPLEVVNVVWRRPLQLV